MNDFAPRVRAVAAGVDDPRIECDVAYWLVTVVVGSNFVDASVAGVESVAGVD